MSKAIKSSIKGKGAFPVTLFLNDADVAALSVLRNKREGDFKLSITAASVHGDTVFITQHSPGGQRIHEFNRTDVF